MLETEQRGFDSHLDACSISQRLLRRKIIWPSFVTLACPISKIQKDTRLVIGIGVSNQRKTARLFSLRHSPYECCHVLTRTV